MTTAVGPARAGRRLWRWVVFCGVVLPVLGVAAIPWGLSSNSGRTWLLARGNSALAPARIELSSIRLSWFGPTRASGVVIRNHQGEKVVDAPRAVWDRNLWQILFQRPKLGTLRLERGLVDARRNERGEIDLYEAIRPVIKFQPGLSLRIELVEGRLRFQSPELAAPVLADRANLDIALVPSPRPLSWHAELASEAGAGSLRVTGSFNQWQQRAGAPGDCEVEVTGREWPIAVNLTGATASAQFDGRLQLSRQAGLWKSTGDVGLVSLALSGSALAGDRVRADRVGGLWNLEQTDRGWEISKLRLDAPFASLEASDWSLSTTEPRGRAQGRVDLAALAAQLPHALRLREGVSLDRGTAELSVAASSGEMRPAVDLSAKVSDLHGRADGRALTLREPATLAARFGWAPAGAFRFDRLSAETPYLRLIARSNATGDTTTLSGSFELAGLERQLREIFDLGRLELTGLGELNGRFSSGSEHYHGELDTRLQQLHVTGIGPISIERHEATIRLELNGPSDGAGVPRGWSDFQTHLTSGDLSGDFRTSAATSSGTLALRGPLVIGDLNSMASARLTGRWRDSGLDIDPLELALEPQKRDSELPPLRCLAHGRFDQVKGILTLAPIMQDGPLALRVADEGVRIAGLTPGGALRVDGAVQGEVGALAAWLRITGRDPKGNWHARVLVRSEEGGMRLGGEVSVDELSWTTRKGRAGPGGPVSLKMLATVPATSDHIDLSEVVVTSPVATLECAGRVTKPGSQGQLDLSGRLIPDWDELSKRLAGMVEPGVHVAGRPHVARISTELSPRWRETTDAEVGINLDEADVFGLEVGKTSLVLRYRGGKPSIDPITVAVNGGKVHLEPAIKLGEKGGAVIHLGPESSLTDVEINETVSHRFLSFVAPVLDNATRVRGSISATLDDAIIPLTGERSLAVEGEVVFQDVQFMPGPFLDPIFGLIGRADRPLSRIDQTVELSIADRRVNQRGLSVPIGKLSRIDIEGWVDFDRNLRLVASVPVVPTALANARLLNDMVGPAMIRVPIRGTLQNPEVDKEAFNLGMKEMGKSVLERSVTRGAVSLFDLITRPRDPGTSPPPTTSPRLTPEQRRERRQEKQAERRRRREGEP